MAQFSDHFSFSLVRLVWNLWKRFEKMTIRIVTYFGAPNENKQAYGPYSIDPWKSLQWESETRLIEDQWKSFEKMTKDPTFDLFWVSEWLENLASLFRICTLLR